MKGLSIILSELFKRMNNDFEINNFSLKINAGEFFCMLGPSGSGKSTLLGLLGGWHQPDKGSIFFGDKEFTDIPTYKRPVRTCFQKGGFLFPHMTVYENIGYSLKIKGVDKTVIQDRVKKLLEQFELPGYENRKISELSGGESQRIAIARAIIDPQPILLLDEIETGLDKRLRRSIREHLIDLTRPLGSTLIYVTHDSSEALGLISKLSSRLAVINDGQLEQVGTAEEIYYNPKSSFVAELTGETNLFKVKEINNDYLITEGGNKLPVGEKLFSNPVFSFIRPEMISFIKKNDSCVTIEGKIMSIEFLGTSIRISVLAKGDLFSILLDPNSDIKTPPIGSNAYFYIPVNKILTLAS